MTARFTTETVPTTVPFEYNAQYIKNVSYNKYDTNGTTGCFFQDHHTLHSYNWYNDNKTGQSSTCTSRYSMKAPLRHCAHVHKLIIQVCKPGESLALRKVKHQLNGRTSVNRLPLMKQDILPQFSGAFKV